ncbi:MAG: AbrB/MazE/SpoVT family DNA-binding domain-containing protein [Anaerolineae bacterium]
MTTIRVSSKRQITIPARMARSLGLSAGDRLILRLEGDRLIGVRAPDSYADAFAGALRGAWGGDVDGYVEAERASWTL